MPDSVQGGFSATYEQLDEAAYGVEVVAHPGGGVTVFFDHKKPPHPDPLRLIRDAAETASAL